MTWRALVLGILTILLAGIVAAGQQTPSLGDLAKQERQKAKPQARRVVTDDDLPARSQDQQPSADQAATQQGAGPAAGAPSTSDTPAQAAQPEPDSSPANTPDPMEELRAKIAGLQQQESALTSKIQDLQEQLAATNKDYVIKSLNAALERERETLKNLVTDRQQAQRELDALQQPASVSSGEYAR
ncbi:MAG: hypothetical protein LAN37_15575 [Acidobacteriia bacterium]|nr:hypothetical protein [Terriglobia bacterium]